MSQHEGNISWDVWAVDGDRCIICEQVFADGKRIAHKHYGPMARDMSGPFLDQRRDEFEKANAGQFQFEGEAVWTPASGTIENPLEGFLKARREHRGPRDV